MTVRLLASYRRKQPTQRQRSASDPSDQGNNGFVVCRPSLLPLTGWLVGAADLPRLLPNADNLFHRKEARQLDVL